MNELYHHGIKGQKWGIRRFQNSDGSLTSAGKKRYAAGPDDIPIKKTSMRQRRRMSSKELDRRIERLQKEKKLKELERDVRDEGSIFASNVIKNSGQKVLGTVLVGGTLFAGKKIVTKFLGKDAAAYITPNIWKKK